MSGNSDMAITSLTPSQRAQKALGKSTKQGTLAGLNSQSISDVFTSMQDQIARALPKHLTPERMIQFATTLVARNPALAACTAQSLIGAVMQASILGLQPVDALGEVYFVPYKKTVEDDKGNKKTIKEVQFQIGYKGYLTLSRNSGEIKMIYAQVVHKGDKFREVYGLNPDLVHEPGENADESPITHAYAVVHYKEGGFNYVVLSRREIEKLRLRSPGQDKSPSGAWLSDYEAMAKAKAIKQLAKYLPVSIDKLNDGIATDGATITDAAFTTNNTGMALDNFEYAEASDLETPPAAAVQEPQKVLQHTKVEPEPQEEEEAKPEPEKAVRKPRTPAKKEERHPLVFQEEEEEELSKEDQERLAKFESLDEVDQETGEITAAAEPVQTPPLNESFRERKARIEAERKANATL